jgi:hypothetical protein
MLADSTRDGHPLNRRRPVPISVSQNTSPSLTRVASEVVHGSPAAFMVQCRADGCSASKLQAVSMAIFRLGSSAGVGGRSDTSISTPSSAVLISAAGAKIKRSRGPTDRH